MEHALESGRPRGLDQAGRDGHGPSALQQTGLRRRVSDRAMGRQGAAGIPDAIGPARPGLLDREAFGADRGELLSLLAGIESGGTEKGYAMGRAGSKARYFGPCVAENPQEARRLVTWFLARHPNEPVYWDLLPRNENAVRIATECGFRSLRTLVRMARPGKQPFRHDDQLVYAIAGLEYG